MSSAFDMPVFPNLFSQGLYNVMKNYAALWQESVSTGIIPVGKVVVLLMTLFAWLFVITVVRCFGSHLPCQDLKGAPG